MKLMLQLYFYKIKVEGIENIPKGVPLLITPNHQNALIDPLLVGTHMPIPIHYLTRSDVFKWWIKSFLNKLNMMPIYRIRDGYAKLSLNDAVFASCREVFNERGSVLMFPEGNHGKEYFLRPLTKGAARLALQSYEEVAEDLMILPVGLNYFEHRKPNSVVLIKFGGPVTVADYAQQYKKNPAKGLIAMRDAIAEAMKKTLVIPEETDDYQQKKELMFQQKNEHLSFSELKALNFSESIDENRHHTHLLAKIFNPIPFLIIHRVLNKEEDVVFHSTLKFALGLFAFPVWWMLVFLLLSFSVGINIATLAVIVMVSGLFYSYQR